MIENLYVFRTDEKGEKRSGTSTIRISYYRHVYYDMYLQYYVTKTMIIKRITI